MVQDLLEAILFDLLPYTLGEDGYPISEVGIDLATRVVPLSKDLQDRWQEMVDRWGLLKIDGKKGSYFITLGQNGGSLLTRLVLARRPEKAAEIPFSRARAVTLDYLEHSEDRPQPREIHYLADWVARLAYNLGSGNPLPEAAKSWFEAGFMADYDRSFALWLQSARAGDQGSIAEALFAGARAETQVRGPERCGFDRFVRPRLGRWCASHALDARQFAAFCERSGLDRGLWRLRITKLPNSWSALRDDDLKKKVTPFISLGKVREVLPKRPRGVLTHILVDMAEPEDALRLFEGAQKRPWRIGQSELKVELSP
jgi:hypothetical protein